MSLKVNLINNDNIGLYNKYKDKIEAYYKDIDCPLELYFTSRIYLQDNDNSLEFFIDYNEPKFVQRINRCGQSEAIIRACCCKQKDIVIFDATAGLGRESFILAQKYNVYMFERNPVVRLLIEQGLSDCRLINRKPILTDFDSIDTYQGELRANVIYYDPMFDNEPKSALVKKNMQIFHKLIGYDLDCEYFFIKALHMAKDKVVVKRPKGQAPLVYKNIKPSGSIIVGAIRFDIYKSISS